MSLRRHLQAVVTAVSVSLAAVGGGFDLSPAFATSITAGDGGLQSAVCSRSVPQVRIDTSSGSNRVTCFELHAPTGWIALEVRGSYGVINHLDVPVSVAFKLPEGAVYWQAVVAPGKVHNIDVRRHGSTVVELQVSPVATANGAATGVAKPDSGDGTNVVSLRSADRGSAGAVARVFWGGIRSEVLDRNSGFRDRLDASFVVRSGLDGSDCISLESASYPETFVTLDAAGAVVLSWDPDPAAATWCVVDTDSAVTGQFLVNAAYPNLLLSAPSEAGDNLVGVAQRGLSQTWFVDEALAYPGS